MSNQALSCQGIKVKLGSGSPTVYVDIPDIKSFNGPGGAAQVIDVTDLDSAAIEKLMGLPDEGQLSFNINYRPDNAQHMALRAARAAQSSVPVKIVFTDAGDTEWTFDAFVTGFVVQGGVNAALLATVTLEISGAITEA